MKKTHKQIFGCFGLGLVAAMTAVAIALPSPQASAISTVTDTLQVRVVGDTPMADTPVATDSHGNVIEQGSEISDPVLNFVTNYENIEYLRFNLTYTYTNPDGTTSTKVYENIFDERFTDYYPGTAEDSLDLTDEMFNIDGSHGYGHYTLEAIGVGYAGAEDSKPFEFSLAPFEASAEQNESTGMIDVNVDNINKDDVKTIEIYDGDKKIGTVTVGEGGEGGSDDEIFKYIPTDTTTERDIHITIVAKDADGNIIYISKVIIVHFDPLKVPHSGAPDTGGLFKDLNISREDYLITGLIVFFIVGIVGLGVVARGRRANSCRTMNNKTAKRVSRANKSQARSKSNKRR